MDIPPTWTRAATALSHDCHDYHDMPATAKPRRAFTTLPVKPDTLRRLRAYKTMGASYDDVLNELMELNPPASFLREHLRSLEEDERIPWSEVKKKLRL
jgi:hypothetical protein